MVSETPPDGVHPARANHAVEVVEKTTVFKGYFQVDRYRLRHTLHAGGWSAEMTREVFERGHAAAVLMYDPDRDRLVLIEQFRPGAYAAGRDPWLLEIVAGIIEPEESPAEVVRREAIEEAGTKITDLIPITECLMTPGACSETLTIFCGRVDSSQSGGIHGLDQEHEDIRVLTVPFAEAKDWLANGRFCNAAAVIAMQWLCLNRDRLRRIWS